METVIANTFTTHKTFFGAMHFACTATFLFAMGSFYSSSEDDHKDGISITTCGRGAISHESVCM
jgi:hypothetical protein